MHVWLAGVILALGLHSSVAAAEPRTWAWAGVAPEQTIFADLGHAIIDRVEKNLRGELKIKRRFGGVLGDEQSTARMLQQGHVEAWGGSLGAMIALVPELRSLELPFRFRDLPTLQAVLRRLKRGRGAPIQQAFERRGLVLITIGVLGWRNLSSTDRPIHRVEDLKGLRARSQDAEVHLAMWRAFGTVPKATNLNDLAGEFEAEGFQVLDLPASFLFGTSVDARVRYHTLTRHMPQLALVVLNRKAWEALRPEQRAHFADGLDEVVAKGEVAAEAFDRELLELLSQKGVTAILPSALELERFRQATGGLERELERRASAGERAVAAEVARAMAAR